MRDFAYVLVHYFKMRITSVGYIFVYRWLRLAARLKWLWQDSDHTPTFSCHVKREKTAHTRFSTLIEWMEMNEWGISLTPIPIHIHIRIRIHVHGCRFLIAALGCALHLYLNVFKRPTIWEQRRCQWQSCMVPNTENGQRTTLLSFVVQTRPRSQGEGVRMKKDPPPSCSPICLCSARLWLSLGFLGSGCSGCDKSKYVALVCGLADSHFGSLRIRFSDLLIFRWKCVLA